MSLFVAQHQHTAESCPAGHPQMGPMLVQHIPFIVIQLIGLLLILLFPQIVTALVSR